MAAGPYLTTHQGLTTGIRLDRRAETSIGKLVTNSNEAWKRSASGKNGVRLHQDALDGIQRAPMAS